MEYPGRQTDQREQVEMNVNLVNRNSRGIEESSIFRCIGMNPQSSNKAPNKMECTANNASHIEYFTIRRDLIERAAYRAVS